MAPSSSNVPPPDIVIFPDVVFKATLPKEVVFTAVNCFSMSDCFSLLNSVSFLQPFNAIKNTSSETKMPICNLFVIFSFTAI